MAEVVETKIVIPLNGGTIGEVSNIDRVLLEVEDTLVERLGVAVDVTSEITRKRPPRKKIQSLGSSGASSVVRSAVKSHSD